MYFYQPTLKQGRYKVTDEAFVHFKARRVRKGDELYFFDGQGQVALAEVVVLDKRFAECELQEVIQHKQADQPRLILGVPKIPTLEFILQKVVEIGVKEIVLLVCDNTPVKFNQQVFDQKRERWERIIISACEQSETLFKPALSWCGFSDYRPSQNTVMLHPYAETDHGSLEGVTDIMVGPEGGFTDKEINCGAKLRKLNTGVLRADTAAIAAMLLCKINK